jgi:hypothetical protein
MAKTNLKMPNGLQSFNLDKYGFFDKNFLNVSPVANKENAHGGQLAP